MRYLFLYFENEKYWLEIDEQLFAIRQVIADKDSKLHVSCREDCLAEGVIEVDKLDGVYKEIQKHEFEAIWRSATKQYYGKWLKTKTKYSIGQRVEGICKCFYPQGMIIKGKDFIAVYQGKKEVLLHGTLKARIKGYDEENMWLVLE